jgi:CRP/FNR family cyclic AMP-dependent transcriptional regulator
MNLTNLFANERDFISVGPGERIFEAGETGDAMYVVIEGEVTLSVRGTAVGTIGPGELFGEMALIDAGARSATATATAATKLARVDERRFAYLVQQTPFFALHVMRVLANRLRSMDAAID